LDRSILITDSSVLTNSSQFRKVVFETTRAFIDGVSTPVDFISLYYVRGVTFKGCTFRNTTIQQGDLPTLLSGKGIYSINASYTLDQNGPSGFSGLHYGIKAINSDPSYWINIKKTRFEGNYRGIYLSAVDFAHVTQDTLIVPDRAVTSDTCYGLYLDHCTAYKVQENSFVSTFRGGDRASNTIGIVVDNSGTEPNEIYNNRFTDIAYGINSQDINRSVNGMTGLVLKCNDFINTKNDNLVSISNPNHANDWGIALYQGDSLSQTGPAGNTFSPEHTNILVPTDINNTGARLKYYHHFQPVNAPYKVKPNCYFNVTVRGTNHPYVKTTCCPSKLNGGGTIPDDLRKEIAAESDTIIFKESQLSALVDGGNTEALNSEILSSIPPESLELRDQLLGKSPYLSDTAMQSAISKEDVLPNEIIRDVLVANPQSATSDKVLEEMNNRYISMPDSMMAEILAGEDVVSAKEALEAGLASHKAKRNQALLDLIRLYQNDTINVSFHDSLIALLQNQPDLPLKYLLAFEYLNAGDTNSLNNILAAIPSSYNLSQQQTDIHNDYLAYFGVMKSLMQNDKNIFNLDPTSNATIQSLYNTGNEPLKSYAMNIMIAKGSLPYNEPILLPDNPKSSKEKKTTRTGKFVGTSYLKIFPNPAKQYLIAEFNLEDKKSYASPITIQITSIQGYNIETINLAKKQDQVLIITNNYKPGLYICSLIVNGKIIDSIRFAIIQ